MNLDIRKKQLELSKVRVAKEELEFKIFEREQDINRLKDNIEIQNQRIETINNEIKELQGE